jgi:MHS family proline/betaine transporter-like MFS transporter
MSPEALSDWGWRLPFIFGLFVGLAGYALRRGIEETPIDRDERSPLATALHQQLPLLVRLAGLSVFLAVGYYLTFLYIVSWLQTADGIAPAHALEINTLSILGLIPVMLAAGWLADRVGRRRLLLLATAAAIVGSWPLFWLLHHQSPTMILLGQAGFVLIVGLYAGILPSALVEATPHVGRCTAVAIGYNLPVGILGGLTPMTATWLVARTGDDLSPAYILIAAAALSAVAVLFMQETFRQRFQAAAEPAAA